MGNIEVLYEIQFSSNLFTHLGWTPKIRLGNAHVALSCPVLHTWDVPSAMAAKTMESPSSKRKATGYVKHAVATTLPRGQHVTGVQRKRRCQSVNPLSSHILLSIDYLFCTALVWFHLNQFQFLSKVHQIKCCMMIITGLWMSFKIQMFTFNNRLCIPTYVEIIIVHAIVLCNICMTRRHCACSNILIEW